MHFHYPGWFITPNTNETSTIQKPNATHTFLTIVNDKKSIQWHNQEHQDEAVVKESQLASLIQHD